MNGQWSSSLRAFVSVLPLVAALTGCSSLPTGEGSVTAYEIARQPIHDYNIDFSQGNPRSRNEIPNITRIGTDYGLTSAGSTIAECERNTTNCFQWNPAGFIRATLPDGVRWCAAFHSVDGLCRDWREGIRLDEAYPPIILARYQPHIIGLYARVRAAATADFKMELHERRNRPYDDNIIRPAKFSCRPSREFTDIVWPGFSRCLEDGKDVSATDWQDAVGTGRGALGKNQKLAICTWVLTGGGPIEVDEFGYVLATPALPLERRVFLKCFAKLARCYSPGFPLVSDRAHFSPVSLVNVQVDGQGGRPVINKYGRPLLSFGGMDNIPATGLFCLSSAIAAEEGIVARQTAIDILKGSVAAVETLCLTNYACGLLPHFARIVAGDSGSGWTYARIPDSEYSTVDNALYYVSCLLAADILDQPSVRARLLAGIAAIDFDTLTATNGFVSHGVATNGLTLLHEVAGGSHADETVWRHWGGETALVLMLKKANQILRAQRSVKFLNSSFKMDKDGSVYHGRGFIAEVPSLFFPQFGRSAPDSISGVNWRQARSDLLSAQQAFFQQSAQSNTDACRLRLYGLSAGELHPGLFGLPDAVHPYTNTYGSFGTQLKDSRDTNRLDTARNGRVIHPHYVLMSYLAGNDTQKAKARATIETMEDIGLFPPFGLVEAFSAADSSRSLALFSSLNAGFETIAAYHILAAETGKTDLIFEAAGRDELLRGAVQLFYP